MAVIEEANGGGTTETAAERNARLQAAFDAAQAVSTPVAATTPYYPPTSYMAPEMPTTITPDVPAAQIELEGPLSWTVPEIPQPLVSTPSDFYSEGGIPQAMPQATQEDYWGDFYSQGTSQGVIPPVPSSWTEEELEMLGGMPVQQAINWGANYTGQALFGGWNVITGEGFTGAFDMTTGELVNPSFLPSLLSPEFAYALGISDEQRVMMGYNPEYPYELQDIPAGSGDGGGGGGGGDGGYSSGGYSGGGYSPSKGYGYSAQIGLVNWRIGA